MINTPEYICALYFEGQIPCFGGVLALNGKTGDTLWKHWTTRAIFSVDCSLDLTKDKIKDCIICGHGGILHAVNGHNGSIIWEIPIRELSASEEWKLSDIYDAKFIADIDGDEIGDVIASHTIQSREIHSSEILIISGINGNIIHSSILPNTEQLYLAPQKLIHPDGESIFVLVTSSQKQSGGLYIIPQVDLMYGSLNLRKLHHDTGKGTLLPPILVDVTLDGIEDIVTTMFDSTIIIYNGLTFEPVWNYTIPNSEVISIPIPGYYNDDNIPDFMVKHQIRSGFPTYYTVATIIDGKTGKPLLEKPIEDSLSKEMSGLSVTVEGFGNDWFLHWSVDCLNSEGIKEKYQFLKSEGLIPESNIDLSKLRSNSTLITTLYALNQHVGPPGISLYFSIDYKHSLGYNNSMSSKMESYADMTFASERSPKIDRNQKENIFTQDLEDKSDDMNNYYETYGQFATNKKSSSIDSQNDNVNNFNQDYTLQNENKWMKTNTQVNKDYDMIYDGNNNINIKEEQSIDYPQVNELQERKNNINNIFTSKLNVNLNNLSNITNITNILNKINNYFTNFGTKKHIKEINTKEKPTIEQANKFEDNLKKQKTKREINIKYNRICPMYDVQKQPPTGILLPSFLKSKESTSIDLVFSTFSLPSYDIPVTLVQEDLDCIQRKKILSKKKLQYIVKECLNERGVDYNTYQEMIVFRIKLECACPEDMLPNQSCKNISLHQSWSEYLGSRGNGYFKPLYEANFG